MCPFWLFSCLKLLLYVVNRSDGFSFSIALNRFDHDQKTVIRQKGKKILFKTAFSLTLLHFTPTLLNSHELDLLFEQSSTLRASLTYIERCQMLSTKLCTSFETFLSVSSRSPHLITNLQSYIKLCFIFCLAFLLNNVFCCLLSRLWHTCLRKVHHKYTCLDSTWKTNCSNKESRADVCRPLTVNRSCGCPLPWKLCPHYKILERHNPKGGRKGRATKAK